MKLPENENRRSYRKTALAIGTALIVWFCLFQGLEFIVAFVDLLVHPSGTEALGIGYTVTSAAVYAGTFLFAAFLLFLLRRKAKDPIRAYFTPRFPADGWLWLFAVIALNYAMAIANSLIMQWLTLPGETVAVTSDGPYTVLTFILLVISQALVPAVVEETLFRGAILSALKPYGKATALLGSAFMFAFMHGNPYQFLYTVMAGLMLGYVYLRTESIFVTMTIHFCNNFLSCLSELFYANCEEAVGTALDALMTATVFLVGILCLVFALRKDFKKEKRKFADGSFGKILDDGFDYAERPIDRPFRDFLRPTVWVFLGLSVGMMALTLGLDLLG